MIGRSSFCGLSLALILACTVSRHCALVLASPLVHSLTTVVCVLVVVGGCILYVCESLKFVGGTMMVMVPHSTFNLVTV